MKGLHWYLKSMFESWLWLFKEFTRTLYLLLFQSECFYENSNSHCDINELVQTMFETNFLCYLQCYAWTVYSRIFKLILDLYVVRCFVLKSLDMLLCSLFPCWNGSDSYLLIIVLAIILRVDLYLHCLEYGGILL